MKYLLAMIFVFLGGLTVSAQDAAIFTLQSDTPVVVHGEGLRDWDSRYTDPGAVFYHDGQFHMLRNGFQGWPTSVQIGYLTSPDGVEWTEVSEEPVFTTAEVDYAEVAMLAASASVEDDGTWVLYFYTWNNRNASMGEGIIGRATASDPLGPWTPLEAPILTPGSEGAWDDGQVSTPSVVRTDDGYVMYYTGYDQEGNQMIGMATSADGFEWTKYNDPATTDAPFAESDPVLMPLEDVEGFVHQPNVVAINNSWVMMYRYIDPNITTTDRMRLVFATSEDAVHWQRDERGAVFAPQSIPEVRAFFFTELVHQDDTYYLFVEGMHRTQNVTDIYVATYEGEVGE